MTRGEIKTSLQALGYGSDTDAAQNECINSTVRRITGMKRWPWQEATTGSASLTTGISAVQSMPSDILHLDSVRIETDTTYIDLEYEEPEELMRLLHTDRATGAPERWTKRGTSIYVYPLPDTAYTVTIDYVAKATPLTGDSDVAAIPDTYHDAIKWGAAAQMAYRERDWNQYSVANGQFNTAIAEMNSEVGVRQRQSSRQVIQSGRYASGAYLGPGEV